MEPHEQPDRATRTLSDVIRIDAAIALVVGGLIHLQLYFVEGYRDIDKIGPSFLANVVASLVVAGAIVLRGDLLLVRVAAVAVSVGTIVAFALTRTDDGFLDFRETGWNPRPQTAIAMVAEIVVIVLVATSFLPRLAWRRGPTLGTPVAAATLAVLAIATVGLGAVWAGDQPEDVVAGGAVAVSIEGFAFNDVADGDNVVNVSVGDTVTWTNADGPTHNVVGVPVFVSEDLATGGVFEHTFTEAGEFAYICGIHPQMSATVVVE